LIDLSARLGEETRLDLPVSHRDIADFLGLSIETLSRAITELERAQYIVRISTRTLILKDRLALMRIMS
jgi:CRP/FNR family nitrogen fixation transcriptional regulator